MKKEQKQEEMIDDILSNIKKIESKIEDKKTLDMFKDVKEKLNKLV